MNLRVVDEHGRQLGMGRNLAALKAELGGLARSAFQALAALRLAGAAKEESVSVAARTAPSNHASASLQRAPAPSQHASASGPSPGATASSAPAHQPARYVAWTFGELPELMEL